MAEVSRDLRDFTPEKCNCALPNATSAQRLCEHVSCLPAGQRIAALEHPAVAPAQRSPRCVPQQRLVCSGSPSSHRRRNLNGITILAARGCHTVAVVSLAGTSHATWFSTRKCCARRCEEGLKQPSATHCFSGPQCAGVRYKPARRQDVPKTKAREVRSFSRAHAIRLLPRLYRRTSWTGLGNRLRTDAVDVLSR
jgi:hypothetical protein